MFRIASIALAAGLLTASAAVAQTAPAAPHVHMAPGAATPAPKAKLSSESTVRDLMGNAAAKAVLEKHTPQIVASPELELAMDMRFTDLQAFPQAQLTPEIVAAIDADLGKL